MTPLCAVVTGSSRGLGLALVSRLLRQYDSVVALGVRDPTRASSYNDLVSAHPGRAFVVRIDHDDPASVREAAGACAVRLGRVDLLVNCAGANVAAGHPPNASKGPLQDLTAEALVTLFVTNVVGPILTSQAFLPLLRRSASPLIVNVSTSRGSLERTTSGNSFGYSVTKAALNMATRKLAGSMPEGCPAVSVDPGWLRTRMGGRDAPTNPDDAAAAMLDTVVGNGHALNGRFVTAQGEDIPW